MVSVIGTRFPEEVDVFVTPHKRMKALVDVYVDQLVHINYCDSHELKSFLKNLDHIFSEFKLHEQIENKFIIKKLKTRLLELSIKNNITSNGHHDLQLINLIELVHEGFSKAKWSIEELNSYKCILQRHLKDFTRKFIPHMKEEEEVFQPLLMKYFDYDELKNLKKIVIKEHENGLKSNTVDCELMKEETVSVPIIKSCNVDDYNKRNYAPINQLPDELLLAIFKLVDPPDHLNCIQVCKQWGRVACDQSLWFTISPIQWHSFYQSRKKDCFQDSSRLPRFYYNQDLEASECENFDFANQRIVQFIHTYIPKIGPTISIINLCCAGFLFTHDVNKILQQTPNVISLNLCNSRVNGLVFEGCSFRNLTYLSLANCQEMTDDGIKLLAKAISLSRSDSKMNAKSAELIHKNFTKYSKCKECFHDLSWQPYAETWQYNDTHPAQVYLNGPNLQQLSLNGCKNLTNKAIMALIDYRAIVNVRKLDLSGNWNYSSSVLDLMVKKMPKLVPIYFHYCINIVGPLMDEANGCENLGFSELACCTHHKWR